MVLANPKVGDLIRWIVDYRGFMAGTSSADIRPFNPIYEYGIILDVSSQDPNAVIVSMASCGQLRVLHMLQDGFEILSKA